MKKIFSAILLSAMMLLCGCAADADIVTVTTLPRASETAEAAPNKAVSFTIPHETKVFTRPEELAAIKPLFESYLTGNEVFVFAVSAVFKEELYIIGFIYEKLDEFNLPFRYIAGLKSNGGSFEQAFISDNYHNPYDFVSESWWYDDGRYNDTEVYDIDGMLVVKTNEYSMPDVGHHNFFLINEEGLLDNHVYSNLFEPCELLKYQDKLLLNENYTWYDFTAQDKKIVLTEITDYKPYQPNTYKVDFVITVKDFKPDTYDVSSQAYKDDGNFEADINGSEVLTKENFNVEEEDSGWGAYYVYLSKKKFKIEAGTRIILLYQPGMKMACSISGDMDYMEFEHLSLPGVVVLSAQEPGEYTVKIENDEAYQIYITAE